MLRAMAVAFVVVLLALLAGCGGSGSTPRDTALDPDEMPSDSTQSVQSFFALADTWLNQALPTANYRTAKVLRCGTNSGLKGRRVLIRYNISALPSGITIDKAIMRLYLIKVPTASQTGDRVQVFRAANDWTEGGATWLNCSTNYTGAMVDVESTTPSMAGTYLRFNITGLVKAWYYGKIPNRGVFVRGREGPPWICNNLASREDALPAYRPKLIVKYH